MAWHDFVARGVTGIHPARGPDDRPSRAIPGRWIAVTVIGGLWWWAVLRLTLWPHVAGMVEGAVAAGGWGLSLLPVHCVPWAGRRDRGRERARPGEEAWRALTTAWRRRRWGGESGRS